jgi:hypothetical protein
MQQLQLCKLLVNMQFVLLAPATSDALAALYNEPSSCWWWWNARWHLGSGLQEAAGSTDNTERGPPAFNFVVTSAMF